MSPSPVSSNNNHSVEYSSNDWGNGGTVTVKIKNNTSSTKSGWELSWTFSGNQKITNMWNGTYQQTGNAVTVKNEAWNKDIPAGGVIEFGFNISYTGTNSIPSDFVVK